MTQLIRDEPVDAQQVNPNLSTGLAGIIRRCMAKKREERFDSAEELTHALEAQLGKASTAPYTLAAAPTVARPAPVTGAPTAAPLTPPTVMTTAKPAMAEPPRKFSVLTIAVILLLLVGLAGAAVLASHWRDAALARSATVVPPTPASPAQQPAANPAANPLANPPATSSVTVTAVPQIIETTSSAPAPKPAIPAPTQIANTQPPPRTAAPEPVLQPPQPQPSPAPQPAASAADDFYDAAMAKIGQGEAQEARKLLHRALVQDPHERPM